MSKTVENLLEAVVDQKPHDFKEVFDQIMVEKMRDVVDEYSSVVAEGLFQIEEEEETDRPYGMQGMPSRA